MIEELRQFIRHPSRIPIRVRQGQQAMRQTAVDVGQGGVCFTRAEPLAAGETILLEIDTCKPTFVAEGIVRWCMQENDQFLIGVAFKDKTVRFAVRMVEQICHIEAYRHQLETESGQRISSEQAAFRWIADFAGQFPGQT